MRGSMTTTENPAASNRRRQLQRWIDVNFAGLQSAFIASTNDGERQINQGELSGLLKNKSFGERRARSLEKQARMPDFYLEQNPDKLTNSVQEKIGNVEPHMPPTGWPFSKVTLRRVLDLKKSLGGQKGVEAMIDLDETLDIAIQKWELRADRLKKSAA